MKYYIFSHKENKNIESFKKFLNKFGSTFVIYNIFPPMYLQKIYKKKFINYVIEKDLDDYCVLTFYDNYTPKSYLDNIKYQKRNYDIIMVDYSNITRFDTKILYQLLNISFYSLDLFPRLTHNSQKTSAARRIRVVGRSFNKIVIKPKKDTRNKRRRFPQQYISRKLTKTSKSSRNKVNAVTIIEKKINQDVKNYHE